ncbi:MAG: hypothetical protein K2Z81_27330 [Cyanobacteria bacterium]|nr:hypothetical protein [Cyanobacteriota bacterium]
MGLQDSEAGLIVEHAPLVLAVPLGWQEFTVRQPRSIETLRKFHQPRKSDVQLCLYERGHPVTLDSATAFSGVLASTRALQEEDLRILQEILGNLALEGEFQTTEARTVELSGRRVLEVQGCWPKLDIRSCHYFIDTEGDGSTVLEVYFAAPTNEYESIQVVLDTCLNSVEWMKGTEDGGNDLIPQEPLSP